MSLEQWLAIGIQTILAFATVILAIATLRVSSRTAALATETGETMKRTDIHHQESQMPLLVLHPSFSVGWRTEGTDLRIVIHAAFVNAGVGPATRIVLRLNRFENQFIAPFAQTELAPLFQGEGRDNILEAWNYDAPSPPPQDPDFSLELKFRNIFGSWGTLHVMRTSFGRPCKAHSHFRRLIDATKTVET